MGKKFRYVSYSISKGKSFMSIYIYYAFHLNKKYYSKFLFKYVEMRMRGENDNSGRSSYVKNKLYFCMSCNKPINGCELKKHKNHRIDWNKYINPRCGKRGVDIERDKFGRYI